MAHEVHLERGHEVLELLFVLRIERSFKNRDKSDKSVDRHLALAHVLVDLARDHVGLKTHALPSKRGKLV